MVEKLINLPPELSDARVAIAVGPPNYGQTSPYSPHASYPEYPFKFVPSDATNPAYDGVRRALQLLDLDAEHTNTAAWNPLRGIVRPGDKVVLKPNFVRDFRESSPDHADCVITHGAIIRAVLDYVYIALEGRGRIIVADAPHNDADFSAIRGITGLSAIQQFYQQEAKLEVEVYDLRPEQAEKIDGVIVGHSPLPGDPAGYVRVNVGMNSAFAEVNNLCHLLYGSEYDMSELYSHQHDDVHEYLISRTVLDADVVIGIPKLKTHKKVGLTVNFKNLVGINGNKNWLPHHREGTPAQGGDQYSDDGLKQRFERTTVAQFKRLFPVLGPFRSLVAGPVKALGKRLFGDTNVDTVRSGNWYGNDTTWRMALDLNRILMYADKNGVIHTEPVRRFFSVVDGIVAGEGNGPLDATPKPVGLVLAGFNAFAVDMACARLMGFDYRRMPVLYRALDRHAWPLAMFGVDDVRTYSNDARFNGSPDEWTGPAFGFKPHFGWRGHIEWSPAKTEELCNVSPTPS